MKFSSLPLLVPSLFLSLSLDLAQITKAHASPNKNMAYATSLKGKTISGSYKPSRFSSEKKTFSIDIDQTLEIRVKLSQFPQLGVCIGQLNVTDDDIYGQDKTLMDSRWLACENGEWKKVMLSLSVAQNKGVLNFGAPGDWMISHTEVDLSVAEFAHE